MQDTHPAIYCERLKFDDFHACVYTRGNQWTELWKIPQTNTFQVQYKARLYTTIYIDYIRGFDISLGAVCH